VVNEARPFPEAGLSSLWRTRADSLEQAAEGIGAEGAAAREEERREVRKKEKESVVRVEGAEDPDIAGIVPGPQPIPSDEEFG